LVDLLQVLDSSKVNYEIDPETGAIVVISGGSDVWQV
jgi:hypothetical protein